MPQKADPLEGRTATNPTTGQRVIRRNGQWVPLTAVGTRGFTSPQRLRAPDPIAQRNAFSKDYDALRKDRDQLGRYYPTLSQLERFEAINTRQRTGGIQHQDLGGWNVIQNVNEALNPDLKEMSGIASGLQGQARPAGSGATSDFEQRLYRQGVPSPEKTGPVNQSIIAYQTGVMQEEKDRLAFAEAYLNHNGSLAGSQEIWADYVRANPYTVVGRNGRTGTNTKRQSWRQWFGVDASRPTTQPAPTRGGQARVQPPPRQAPAPGQRKRYNPQTGRLE
jgi:hypothetical protein